MGEFQNDLNYFKIKITTLTIVSKNSFNPNMSSISIYIHMVFSLMLINIMLNIIVKSRNYFQFDQNISRTSAIVDQ